MSVPRRVFRLVRGPEDPAPAAYDHLLTVKEIAARLRIGTTKAYELCAEGVLPVVRLPGSPLVRVSAGALEAWIRERTQAAR